MSSTLKKALRYLSWGCLIGGGIALVAAMLLIVADVILRYLLDKPLPSAIELVQCLLVIVVFSGMAYTELKHGHIKVGVLVNKFSPITRLAITTNSDLLAAVVVGVLSWQSVIYAQRLWSMNIDSGLLGIPLWPFPLASAFFMGLFAVAVLANSGQALGGLVNKGTKNGLWLIPGVIVTSGLLVTALWPDSLPIKVGASFFGLICLLIMFALIFLSVHIGAAMAMIALWGTAHLATPAAGLLQLGMTSQTVASNYIWSVIPLFMLMGLIVSKSGLAKSLYDTTYKWLGHLPGGLAVATIGACTAFAAVVGDTLTGTVTMGAIALPEMEKYKYDTKLTVGSICAGGSIGILIPPSLGFVVYALMVGESIGKLFIAGIIPGIIISIAFILLVSFQCRINPQLGPPGPATKFKEKVVSLKGSLVILALFVLVIGGIYLGIFTPTEAGAVGAFAALVIGLVSRRLTFRALADSLEGAMQMVAMVFFIFIYATAVTQFIAMTDLPFALANFIGGLAVSRYVTLAVILFAFLLLGCVMNALPVLILTLPVVFPIAVSLGFDPIWFGVLVVIMAQIGTITPPIGITVFALAGISNVPMYTIFRGVAPFCLAMILVIGILIAFPEICLFLPSLMMGG